MFALLTCDLKLYKFTLTYEDKIIKWLEWQKKPYILRLSYFKFKTSCFSESERNCCCSSDRSASQCGQLNASYMFPQIDDITHVGHKSCSLISSIMCGEMLPQVWSCNRCSLPSHPLLCWSGDGRGEGRGTLYGDGRVHVTMQLWWWVCARAHIKLSPARFSNICLIKW